LVVAIPKPQQEIRVSYIRSSTADVTQDSDRCGQW
jgi:hypothetical protein